MTRTRRRLGFEQRRGEQPGPIQEELLQRMQKVGATFGSNPR